MFKNYIKTAWRNLVKNKFYSVINIFGLTVGLAIGILILVWVQDELSFDGFHKNAKDIYRLELFGGTGNSRQIYSWGVAPIGVMAKQQLPEVKEAVRITGNYDFRYINTRIRYLPISRMPTLPPRFFRCLISI